MDAKHKMERFAKIVNSYKPLSICAKRSILDVGRVLNTLLVTCLPGKIKKFSFVYHKAILFQLGLTLRSQNKIKTLKKCIGRTLMKRRLQNPIRHLR